MYCPACQLAFRSFWLEAARKANSHHNSYESLCQSADSGCPACRKLFNQLPYELRPGAADVERLRGTVTTIFSASSSADWCWGIWLEYSPSWLCQLASYGEAHPRIGISYTAAPIPTNKQRRQMDQDSESQRLSIPCPSGMAIGESTASPETWTLIYRWLQECLHSHSTCRENSNRLWMPSRLLDVRPDGHHQGLRLHVTGGNSTCRTRLGYVTLSHRWSSGSNILTLTKENLSTLCQNIDPAGLSQTFKDAVRITRRLGIRYLWIDSLCIVQNDPDDWAREAAAMKSVYMGGLLNIAATGAENSSQGCFFQRNTSSLRPFPTGRPDLTSGRPHTWVVIPTGFWTRNVESSTLNSRGWVLQERVLAPRLLHFSTEQVFWECRQLRACESFPGGVASSLCGVGAIGGVHIRDLVPGRALGDYRDMSQWMEFDYWQKIVEKYAACGLTFRKDKLIALSGVAREVQGLLHSEYIAGMWRDHLPLSLLWSIGKGSFRPEDKEYIAPSWSWASIDGPVHSPDGMTEIYRILNRKGECLTILDMGVTLANLEDPFGQVTDGYLTARGKLGIATWWPSTAEPDTDSPDTDTPDTDTTELTITNYIPPFRVYGGIENPRRFSITLYSDYNTMSHICVDNDMSLSSGGEQQAYFVPVYMQSGESFSTLEGLLLKLLPCGRFVRVGKLVIDDDCVDEMLDCLLERNLVMI